MPDLSTVAQIAPILARLLVAALIVWAFASVVDSVWCAWRKRGAL